MDTLTQERLPTVRWNNLLALGPRIPALATAFSAQCGPSTMMMSQPGPDDEWVKRASSEGAGVLRDLGTSASSAGVMGGSLITASTVLFAEVNRGKKVGSGSGSQ